MKKTLVVVLSIMLCVFIFAGCTSSSAPGDGLPEPDTGQTVAAGSDNEGETPSDPGVDQPSESSRTNPSGELKVHFIDVGQGDAILVQTPSQNILVDGGNRGTTVVNYLKSLGINSLDLVISTHPHADHIGGLINVIESIPVREVIDPAVVHTTKTFEDYLTLIDKNDIIFTEGRAGMSRDLGGGARMDILHPSSPSSSHLNDASIVTKVTFGQISFMLTGDAEKASESKILLQSTVQPTSTVLKVGHHGSRTSTTSAFLKAVAPKVAVIMCGKGNTYGHPHEETLANLAAAGVDIYRTDIHGTIVITTDGQTFDINQKQPYQYNPQKVPEPAPKSEATAPVEPKPEPVTEPTHVSQGAYVGSVKSDKYHKPECRHAKNILPENEIWFKTVKNALDAEYVPCGVCRPPGN